MLSVGRRTAGVDHAKLRELLLVTTRTCDLLRFVNERIIANALIQFQISTEKHRMGRPNRDGINSPSGVVNQESAWRLESREPAVLDNRRCHRRLPVLILSEPRTPSLDE